jgi:hypothetical protein
MIKDHIHDIGGSLVCSIIVGSHVRKKLSLGKNSSMSVLENKPLVVCSAPQKPYRLSLSLSIMIARCGVPEA